MYVSTKRKPKYLKQKLIEQKGWIYKSIIKVGDQHVSLSNWQKISTDTWQNVHPGCLGLGW